MKEQAKGHRLILSTFKIMMFTFGSQQEDFDRLLSGAEARKFITLLFSWRTHTEEPLSEMKRDSTGVLYIYEYIEFDT